MELSANIAKAKDLPQGEQKRLGKLIDIYNSHKAANGLKRRYYEGHVRLEEVNLGLALPNGIGKLEIGCAWGEKAVDVLAARSMFDGFVGANGEDAAGMTRITAANRLVAEYMKACRDELKYGCTFATLSANKTLKCKIRFHSPETAAAEWDGEKGRIGCGFAVIAQKEDPNTLEQYPTVVNYYTDEAIWTIRRGATDQDWIAEFNPHIMKRPMMEPLIWNATSVKPFGRSRLKEPVRRLIQGYIRTVANATIGLEFATSPQKYLLGITDEQYDTLISEKFRAYVGSLIMATTNPETGEKPSFGQLSQGTIEPHVQMLRMLATQFSAATGLTVTDTGVINDANPTSSDAIIAQSQTLILMAEQLNAGNGDSLHMIAQMAQAIARDVPLEKLTEEERAVVPHFKNPAMPSIASTSDAAIKIASARNSFAQTDVFLEMIGFSQADIRRIKAQEQRTRGLALIDEIEKANERRQGETE